MNALDASAVLAVLDGEPIRESADELFADSLISAVNLSEVLQKATQRGISATEVARLLGESRVGVVPFDEQMAIDTATLWPKTRAAGLSLADRACLVLARSLHGVAITADRAWAELDLPLMPVHLIR